MTKSKKTILFWGLFVIIFASLLVIATLFDKQISDILAKPYLANGSYFSTNVFARILEVIGEMPLYIFSVTALIIIILKCKKIENKKTRLLLIGFNAVVAVGVGTYGWKQFFEYLYDFYPTQLALFDETYFLVIEGLISIAGCFLIYLLANKFLINHIEELLPIAIIIIIAAIVSNGLTQGIKPFVGRERYRATYYLTYRNVDSIGFTPWYVINGKTKDLIANYDPILNVTKTFYTSFPSGHTTGAGIVYSMMFIPCFVKSLNTTKHKVIFTSIAIFYTGLVAFSRIVMGAHFMSDVLFGGTIVFLSNILGYVITKKFFKTVC